MNIHNPNITLPNALRWYAQPYSASAPDAMRYDTVLVLDQRLHLAVRASGRFSLGGHFSRQQGSPSFAVTPFGPQEWFAHGGL